MRHLCLPDRQPPEWRPPASRCVESAPSNQHVFAFTQRDPGSPTRLRPLQRVDGRPQDEAMIGCEADKAVALIMTVSCEDSRLDPYAIRARSELFYAVALARRQAVPIFSIRLPAVAPLSPHRSAKRPYTQLPKDRDTLRVSSGAPKRYEPACWRTQQPQRAKVCDREVRRFSAECGFGRV